MDILILGFILFGSLLLFIMIGIPIAFTMGALSLIFGFIYWGGTDSFIAFTLGSYGKVMEFTLTAVPLYIFMAAILRYSDLADDMYETIYRWFGGLKGGLAVGTTIIASIFAAMVGIATVATATLGVTARQSMIKRGYNSNLTSGAIMAGGSLGILIPPSIIMIIYAAETGASGGKMFMGGILPGILGMIIFIIYALIVCHIDPTKGNSLPKEERYSWKEKFESLKGVTLPLGIIIFVLGSIYFGIATVTEAAAVGVVGSLISAALKKKLYWANIKKMLLMAANITGMVFWLVIGAVAYSKIVAVTGVGSSFAELISGLDVNKWIILILMQIVFFILGMFLEPAAILLMTAPVFMPVVVNLGFDIVWYGVLFIINMCVAYMSPPFGYNLFVLKAVAPEIETIDLYKSAIPYILLYILLMIIVIIFPQLVLWLPNIMMD